MLSLGLRAVKPAYYIIYKSGHSGLYEYLAASAIQEITGVEFSENEEIGWSNAKEFLQRYTQLVRARTAAFAAIINDGTRSRQDYMAQIQALGIYAVAPILHELDDPQSAVPAGDLEECLVRIVEEFTGETMKQGFREWRAGEEAVYRDLVEVLEITE